jgi:hypothetical protein
MLEMLGMAEDVIIEPIVEPPPSRQPLWQAPPPVETARRAGLDRLPSLSDMQTVNDHHTDTGTLIERLWVATEEHDAVREAADLRAEQFQTVPGRAFRWSIVIGAVLVLAIVVAALQIAVRTPGRIANEAIASYRTALITAQEVVPSAEQVMLAITDPSVGTEALSDAAVTLSELDTASRALFTIASEPLSSTPPFVSRDELESLTPVRTDMANASQEGLAIERRLGDALTYRLVFTRTFPLPDLPVTASPDEISALGVELGLGLAATLDAIQALPNDPAFEAHRLEATSLAERFAAWQVEYVSALRAADLTAASDLTEELQTAVDNIHAGVAGPLATVAGWATREISEFGSTLHKLEAQLP